MNHTDGRVDASRWARSVGIRTPCTLTKDALTRIGGFSGGLEAATDEQIASVAMAILRTLKKVAFGDDAHAAFPITFLHRGMSMTRTLELVATKDPDVDQTGVIMIDACRRRMLEGIAG